MTDFSEDSTGIGRRGKHDGHSRRRVRNKRPPKLEEFYKTDEAGTKWVLTYSRNRSDAYYHRWIAKKNGAIISDTHRRPDWWDKINHINPPATPVPLIIQLLRESEFIQDQRTMEFWERARKGR